jgi:hemolysin III
MSYRALVTLDFPPIKDSPAEKRMNLLTHAAGAVMSIAALIMLLVFAAATGDPWRIVTVAIFGTSLVMLYSASTCYHACSDESRRRRFKSIDHAAIYLLIAGTYTPFLLVLVRGAWGWSISGVLWALALAGVIFKVHFAGRFRIASTLVYIAMGWIGLIAIRPIIATVPLGAIHLLIAGGVVYTSGVVFYLWDGLRFNHAIWHLFVIAGSTLHFFAVLKYVVPEMP